MWNTCAGKVRARRTGLFWSSYPSCLNRERMEPNVLLQWIQFRELFYCDKKPWAALLLRTDRNAGLVNPRQKMSTRSIDPKKTLTAREHARTRFVRFVFVQQHGNHQRDLRRSCEHGYNTDCQKSRRSDWPLTYLTFMLTTDVHGPCPKITSYPRNPSNLHSVNVGLFSREGVLLFRVSSKMKIRLASEPVLCSLPLSSDFHFATLSAQQNFFPAVYNCHM